MCVIMKQIRKSQKIPKSGFLDQFEILKKIHLHISVKPVKNPAQFEKKAKTIPGKS